MLVRLVCGWVRGDSGKVGEGRRQENGGEEIRRGKRKSRTEQKASDEHQLFNIQPLKLFAIA